MWEGWTYPLPEHTPLRQEVITKRFCTDTGRVKMSHVTVRAAFWNPSALTREGALEPMESRPIVLYVRRVRGVKPFVLRVAELALAKRR